jgi:glycine/D-amino acid oxidase-like deaminating enzyme
MPVEQRDVEAQLDAVAAAGFRQLGDRVALKGRVRHLVVAQRRVVHAEAVVVAAGDDDVLLPGVGGVRTQASASKRVGLNCGASFSYSGAPDAVGVHHPFVLADDAVQPPMDEHAKAGVLKPGETGG